MKKISIFILCLCAVLYTSAQYNNNRNKIWAFGNHAGLSFTSGSPLPISSSISTDEGCASICNTAGSLLFYTDGKTVYNRLGTVMPNGATIVPFITNSSTQGALIVPFTNDSNKYYVFSLEQVSPSGQLAYSIVDMTLDGGLGDLVSGSSGIILETGMSEKMIAIPGDACNVWVVTHKKDYAQFYAYEITSSGLSTTPLVSNVGTFTGASNYVMGAIKCSHDRQKIASICYQSVPSSMWGVELFDFNPATGLVSNCRVLESNPSVSNNYSAEFSPDNTKLYTAQAAVYQWDVSLPTSAAIVASKTTIIPAISGTLLGDMKLGPNGKIYVAKHFTNFLDCISLPNVAGSGCGYVSNAINLYPGISNFGLPNLVWNTNSVWGQSTICTGTTTTLTTSAGGGIWTSSNTGVATISPAGVVTAVAAGTSVISYVTGPSCGGVTTINVVTVPTLTSASVCVGNNTGLTASTGAGTWISASTGIATVGAATGMVTGMATGTTIITFNGPGCPPATTVVTVTIPSITGSTAVCVGTTRTLSSAVSGGTWISSSPSIASIGSLSGVVTGAAVGTVLISYSVGGCTNTAIVTVNAIPGLITGVRVLCEGSDTILSCSPSGGAWSSGSPAATISTSGKLTGVSAGTAIITYAMPGGCFSTAIATVNQSPAPIVGPTTIAIGSSVTLTNAIAGGTWSSSNIASVTINSTGKITGIYLGTSTIYYTLPNGCSVSALVTVKKIGYLSIDPPTITKPTLYPNPASDEITIKTEQSTFTSFTIYNAVGQVIATHQIIGPEMKVNVKAFPPGQYQVIFTGEGEREMLRFVKW